MRFLVSIFILFTVVFICVQTDDECLLLDGTNSVSQSIHEHQQACNSENTAASCSPLCILHSVASLQLTSNTRKIFENFSLIHISFYYLSPFKLQDNSLQEIKPPCRKLA
ncbi:MAG: hypothetical protein A2X86_12845 [Bdellovibrionales bacterium GWA2_49_15]|nr:MAG: hypothetical protein A2X86_12845 [Bdellovibrionales bacterium GWA2_49_15]HAZ13872.1 hypothetical protein [Bdellovibrionales bacterium]